MGSLWTSADTQTAKRRNREAIIGRLLNPMYDVDQALTINVNALRPLPNFVTTTETTHYTAGAGVTVSMVHSITLCNVDVVEQQASVHLINAGGARSAANAIFADILAPGETVILRGPWFIDPSDTLRSISAAGVNKIALRAEVCEFTGAITGVNCIVDDGNALMTSMASYFTCPASGIRNSMVVAITICNTDVAERTVTVEILPSGGATSPKQYIAQALLNPGETLILGGPDQPFIMAPGDAIWAKADAGAVVGFRVTPVDVTT